MDWLKKGSSSCHCRPKDIAWLSSQPDSELDLLVSIKDMVIQRAKAVGVEEWAHKFDLKTLRAIDVVLQEYLKELVANTSLLPKSAKDASNPVKSATFGVECHGDADTILKKDVDEWKSSSLSQKQKLNPVKSATFGVECHGDANTILKKHVDEWKSSSLSQKRKLGK